jgi:hypothetical protein
VGDLSFEIVEGPDAGRVVPLAGSLVIGSDEAVEVVPAIRTNEQLLVYA